MNIGIITSLYEPYARGGVEVVVKTIVQELKSRGHDVSVITLGRKKEKTFEEGITLYRILPWNIFSFIDIAKKHFLWRMVWHPLDMFNISAYFQVQKILQKNSFDVIFTHNLKGIGYLIPRVIRKFNIFHVHTLHDVQLSRPSGIIFFGQEKPFLILDKIYEKLCKRLFGSPDVIVSPSQWLLQYYRVRGFFYRSRWVHLPNPVKDTKKIPWREREERENIVFLYVGQLEGSKGIRFLVESLKKFKEKNFVLKIVGSGSLEETVRNLIEGDGRFQLYGYVKPSHLGNIYPQADFTIVPSLCYENSPLVIYESFSFGVGVIASDIGGISEIVKDGVNGFTFVPGNFENFSRVIHFVFEHPELLKTIGENARKTPQEYTAAQYILRLEKIASK